MKPVDFDYLSHLTDEIALEGLDGITFDALWIRLANRANFTTCMPIDENSKEFFWSLIKYDKEIHFYKLPEPRPPLVIFNRYQYMDQELGIVLEPASIPEDIYKFVPVKENDKRNVKGDRGSCAHYYTRKNITDEVCHMNMKEIVEKYDESFVMVASQKLRNKALCIDACIDQFYDLTSLQYQILERVARSRTMGEITQGKMSLAIIGENPKSMFYHRKRLLKLNLVTKQPHQQKGFRGQSQIGSLIHLTRFYVERRSKFIIMIQRAVEILQNKPNFSAPYNVLKEEMAMPEPSSRKLFKSTEFQKYIKIVQLPYREVYPDADPSEWKYKVKDVERIIRCLQLINPTMDPNEVCKNEETNDFDEDDEETYSGILNQNKLLWGVSLLQQAYHMVENAGPEGVSQTDIARRLGQTKLDARTICRNLQRRNTVHSLMKDVGRQRVSRYVSHKFAITGHLTQEFHKERQRMMSMIEDNDKREKASKKSATERKTDSETSSTPSHQSPKPSTSQQVFDPVESEIQEKPVKETTSDIKGLPNLLDEIKLTYINQKRKSPHVTTRMMKRANIIIQTVKEHKVIDDAFKLQKLIVQSESEEGLAAKMDKKSLNRLLDKLARGGFLRIINVNLKHEKHDKALKFVVHSSVSTDDDIFKSTIEQQKMKFLTFSTEEVTPKTEPPKVKSKDPTVDASMMELRLMQQLPNDAPKDMAPKKGEGLKGSLNPKFVRMQELHKLLFYLIYGYEGNENLDQEAAWKKIRQNVDVSQEDIDSYPTVFLEECSWKMFIPPLPHHARSGPGWAFVCDVLLRLPLCVFVRLVSVVYSTPDLKELLEHPIKKNLLIKFLPSEIRRSLLQGRKYVTYVLVLISRLCYIGLTQFGHQVMKEKDQVFIYLNRKASLIDTTTSSPGYHQISTDKEYVRNNYNYQTLQDIEQYWYDMWTICMHTPLGGHNCMEGKKITIQILERKPQIMETLVPHTVQEAPEYDIGKIPGDGRGAAGLDSALFSHLKRNWATTYTQLTPVKMQDSSDSKANGGTICYTNYLMNTVNSQPDGQSSKHRLSGLRGSRLSVYKPKQGVEPKIADTSVALVDKNTKVNGRKRKRANACGEESVAKKSSKPTSYQRELKVRRKVAKKPYYDEEDKAALRRMKKLRVDWSPAEDSFLLLCKVGCCYLFPNKRGQMITFSLVRSLLHHRFPESRNKTSRACQRRINYIMKNPTTENNVAIFLEEVKQDPNITQNFKIPTLPCSKSNVETIFSQLFRDLMDCLMVKFTKSESRKCPDIPNTLKEFNDNFQIIVAASSLKNKLKFNEVKSISDIDFHVVNSLIYSSLCTIQDRESFAYQLYLAYQQYPQTMLTSVLQSMRSDQMISYKKRYNRSLVSQSCLPLSTSPFQLSVSYLYLFNSKYPYEIFGQAWNMYKTLLNDKIKDLDKTFEKIITEPMKKTRRTRVFKKQRRLSNLRGKKNPENTQDEDSMDSDHDSWYINRDHSQNTKTPIVINHEGGYSAAIVALMASKRLTFDCHIPEQIILKDDEDLVPKGSKSMIQRFSDHVTLSGRKLDDVMTPDMLDDITGESTSAPVDTPVNNQDETSTTSVISSPNESKKGILFSCNNITISSEGFGIPQEPSQSLPESLLQTDNLEIDLNDDSLSLDKIPDNADNEIKPDISQGRTSIQNSSRVSLFMLRETFSKSNSQNIISAQEHFLVNACQVSCTLSVPPTLKSDLYKTTQKQDAIKYFEPCSKDVLFDVDENCKRAIVQVTTTFEEKKKEWETNELPNEEINLKTEIYMLIESTKEIGAPIKELKEKYESRISELMKSLHDLQNDNLIIKVGVATIRWVSLHYMKPWVIQTNKLSREMRQAVPRMTGFYSLKKKKEVDVLQTEHDELMDQVTDQITQDEFLQNDKTSEKPSKMIKLDSSLQPPQDMDNNMVMEMTEDSQTEEEAQTEMTVETDQTEETEDYEKPEPIPAKRKRKKKIFPDSISNDESDNTNRDLRVVTKRYFCAGRKSVDKFRNEMEGIALQHNDNSDYEQIDVAVRPWIRLNGTLNRRVLDRLLGSLLIVVMERPGITRRDVATRFSPGLQPAHTYDLLDILFDLNCITKHQLVKSHKPRLFSSPVKYVLKEADKYDCSEDLIIEPTVDCILKLAMFIGDKTYTSDFLSGERS